MMRRLSPGPRGNAFALFAALDLSCLLALSHKAIGEARHADPAGLLAVFASMQAIAVCGLLLLAFWVIASRIRRQSLVPPAGGRRCTPAAPACQEPSHGKA